MSAQHPWRVSADSIISQNYYGVSVANGMIGIVSSPEPLKVKNVILAGLYDQYGRGRVSNFIQGFNLLNLKLNINGRSVNAESVSNFHQELDMKKALFTTSFDLGDRATVKYSYSALRHLPYCVLATVEVIAKKDITLTAVNVIETPDA